MHPSRRHGREGHAGMSEFFEPILRNQLPDGDGPVGEHHEFVDLVIALTDLGNRTLGRKTDQLGDHEGIDAAVADDHHGFTHVALDHLPSELTDTLGDGSQAFASIHVVVEGRLLQRPCCLPVVQHAANGRDRGTSDRSRSASRAGAPVGAVRTHAATPSFPARLRSLPRAE